MLGYANHLGLHAEETGASGEALENFPRAFTHLAWIRAAVTLEPALGEQCEGPLLAPGSRSVANQSRCPGSRVTARGRLPLGFVTCTAVGHQGVLGHVHQLDGRRAGRS